MLAPLFKFKMRALHQSVIAVIIDQSARCRARIEAPRSFIPSPPMQVTNDDAFSAAAGSIRSRDRITFPTLCASYPVCFSFYDVHTRRSRFPFSFLPSAPCVDTCNCAIIVYTSGVRPLLAIVRVPTTDVVGSPSRHRLGGLSGATAGDEPSRGFRR